MKRLFRTSLAILALCGFALLCQGKPTFAATETESTAIQQSDGIVDRVVDNLWDRSDFYWHHGDYNRIIALLRVCVSANPSFVEGYSDGAWLIWSMGDIPGSIAFLEDGMKYSPARADIAFAYGDQLFAVKKYADAAKYFRKSIDYGAKDRLAYTELAHSYRLCGRYDDSIAAWKQVIEKFPDFAPAKTNLARVEALKAHGDPAAPTKTGNAGTP